MEILQFFFRYIKLFSQLNIFSLKKIILYGKWFLRFGVRFKKVVLVARVFFWFGGWRLRS